jgi:hypothetical protein
MFFDPGTKPEVKADPLSLDSLIAWLEKQPADMEYDYLCNGHCLLGEYFRHVNPAFYSVGPYQAHFREGNTFTDWDVPRTWDRLAVEHPRTFGAALKRARKLAAQAH